MTGDRQPHKGEEVEESVGPKTLTQFPKCSDRPHPCSHPKPHPHTDLDSPE